MNEASTITEKCQCGATFTVSAAYAPYARTAVTEWRAEHQHEVVEPGLCWSPAPDVWPLNIVPRCELRAGHTGAHECDRGPMGRNCRVDRRDRRPAPHPEGDPMNEERTAESDAGREPHYWTAEDLRTLAEHMDWLTAAPIKEAVVCLGSPEDPQAWVWISKHNGPTVQVTFVPDPDLIAEWQRVGIFPPVVGETP